MELINQLELSADIAIFLRILVAMALGGLIGFERELIEKPAGLRTHVLVAGAAALLVTLGDVIVSQFSTVEAPGVIRSDPLRIFEAIIVGVSFLGTGTIWRSETKKRVEGLTTAASLLFTAALGIAVALDKIVLAVALTLLVLVINWGVGRLEHALLRRKVAD